MKNIKQKIINFLIWSQKWTKTDMIYFAKGGFWITLEKIVFSLVGIVSMLAFANFVDPETYGIYQYILSIFAILQFFGLSGINGTLSITVAKGNSGTYISALKEKIKWGTLGSLISLIGGIYYLTKQNEVLGLSFLAISIIIPFIDSLYLYNPYLLGLKKFKEYSLNNILIKTISTVLIIATVFLTNNIFILILVSILPGLLLNLLLSFKYYKKYPPNNSVDKESISLGKHLSLIGFFSSIVTNLDKVIIFQFLGAKEVAIYVFAIMPITKIATIIGANISTLSLPKISGKSVNELKLILPSKVKTLSVFIFIIVIIYVASAPTIYKILLPQYLDSVLLSQVFALSLLFLPISLFQLSLTTHSKKKQLYVINFFIPVFKMILFVILLPTMGAMGMIISLLIADATAYALSSFLFYKIKA